MFIADRITAGQTRLLPQICQAIADLDPAASKDTAEAVMHCNRLMVAIANEKDKTVATTLFTALNYGCLEEREFGGTKQVTMQAPCPYDVVCSLLYVLDGGKAMCKAPERPFANEIGVAEEGGGDEKGGGAKKGGGSKGAKK